MKLTKKQIVELNSAFISVGDLKGAQFSYAIAKNTSLIESEVKAIQKAYVPSKEFLEYDGERVKLAETHANKIDGRPEIVKENGLDTYKIKDLEKFTAELKTLQSKYETVIKAREDQIKDVEKILDETIEISFYTISPKDIPFDIKAKQLKDIFVIIKEDEIVKEKVVN